MDARPSRALLPFFGCPSPTFVSPVPFHLSWAGKAELSGAFPRVDFVSARYLTCQPRLIGPLHPCAPKHRYGEAIVTLSGHVGTYAKFMGMYELDLRHIVHGYSRLAQGAAVSPGGRADL